MRTKYQFHSRREKIEYFFDYYKGHVVAIASILVVLIVLIRDITAKPEYDYTIGLAAERPYGNEALQSLSEELSKHGEDLNEDGEILIDILCYSFIEEDPTSETIAELKYYADYEMELADIYFTEPNVANYILENGDYIEDQKHYTWSDVTFGVICRSSAKAESQDLWHSLP